MDEQGFLVGQMLIAMPGIGDPRFERALVLVCAHDETYAMGIAVNRPVEGLTVPDLLRRLDVERAAGAPEELVMMGGPVERERGFVLHTDDYLSKDDNSLMIGGSVALTATREALSAMATRTPRRALLALGYAGWGAGQLEQEIRNNVWLTCDADESLIFDGSHEGKWAKALAKLGVNASLLTAEAGRA